MAPDLVDSLPELLHDVEPVENMKGLRGFFGDHFQIGLPHVAAHEPEPSGALLSEHPEEPKEGFDPPFGTAPQKAAEAGVQLVDHGEVLVSFEYGNLVHSDLGDPLEGAMGQSVVHNRLDGPEHTPPAGLEHLGRLFPGKSPGPPGQKNLVSGGHAFLSVRPGDPFGLDSIPRTVHPPGGVPEDHPEDPERDIVEFPDLLRIVGGSFPTTDWTFRTTVLARLNLHDEGLFSKRFLDPGLAKHKRLELLHAIE